MKITIIEQLLLTENCCDEKKMKQVFTNFLRHLVKNMTLQVKQV